ncbi:MAG: UvrD-helicase domain-containing protein [Planctomycetes bacterium]|nr:UvrD-helicase domain-containing protein [Planctomycetota bacterium]
MSDASARREAVSLTSQNVVLRASAGTGKTTVLVERLLVLLLRDGLKPDQIVAITFTEDAAANMKSRLRRRLQDAFRWSLGEEVKPPIDDAVREAGDEAVGRRAAAALEQLDRAIIETIHAFAGRLLRLFPEESGVDASFAIDDETAVAESIDRDWAAWSREEFAENGKRLARWRPVLRALPWDRVRELAFRLADFEDVPGDPGAVTDEARAWHAETVASLEGLVARAKKPVTCVEQARAALELLQRVKTGGWKPAAPADERFEEKFGDHAKSSGWTDAEHAAAEAGWRAAQAWSRAREEAVEAVRLLADFAAFHRETALRHGRLSFNALLFLARDLLRAKPHVARRFRDHRFLVDEFQDTDAKQAEIVLRLASPAAKADWRSLRPDPGRLFVVGDPKQSIYAWRGADLGVYDAVCAQLVAAGARDLLLARNFRCQPAVVDAANRVFDRAFQPEPGIQAPPSPLEAARPERKLGGRIVELRTAKPDEGDRAPELAEKEAKAIAAWIGKLHGDTDRRIEVDDGDGPAVKPVRLRDIAILLRQTTHLPEYLHALREARIPYVVTREQHFYEAQEVRDAINLLLALVRPDDALSLSGVLRSPVGGLTFAEIQAVGARPDFRKPAEGRAEALFANLRDLRARALKLPVAEAVDHILDESGLRAAAAASAHGEQALANLEKIAALAARRASPELTLREFADRLGERLREPEREAESPLGEPDDEVVRVSTIHGAKGLEWPVVILAGLHTPRRGGRHEDPVLTDAAGFAARAGDAVTPLWAFLDDRRRRRAAAEDVRLFYVACTRAREALVLSRAGTGEGAYLPLVPAGTFPEVEAPITGAPRASLPRQAPLPAEAEIDSWKERREEYEEVMRKPAVISPTGLMHHEDEAALEPGHSFDSPAAKHTGILVHSVLERWNFAGDDLDRALARAAAQLPAPDRAAALPRARELLAAFLASADAREIASNTILGREIPFAQPLQDGRTITGVIDLLFEKDGRLEIRDYKTGRENPKYEVQQQVYLGVVKKLFPGRDVVFRFIYLHESGVKGG